VEIKTKTKSSSKKTGKTRKFPYLRVAELWAQGLTLREIAEDIGYVDAHNIKDPCHTLRTFLTKMHGENGNPGYIDATGQKVKLPYRARAKRAAASA
jgi:hypothetical protein